MPQLFVLSGPEVGKSFVVKPGAVVGRTPECAIALKHASISRHHAHFECSEGRWTIVDDGSRNGLVHDKRRVEKLELEDQLEFQLGEILLRFRSADPEPASAAPRPARAPVVAAQPPAVEELTLEGADELSLEDAPQPGPSPAPAPRPAPPAVSAPAAQRDALRAPVDPHLVLTQVSPRVPPAPPPQFKNTLLDTGFGPAPASAGGAISRSKERAGERILQFNKIENTRGLAHADMAQLSAPVKWLLGLLAIAVMAALAWLAFSGTAFLKQHLGGGAASDEAQDEPAAPPADGEARDAQSK